MSNGVLVPQPFPYQGSKRKLAPEILKLLPNNFRRLYEPFCGSAAISLAALATDKTAQIVINDSYKPLQRLWIEILENHEQLSYKYRDIWNQQSHNEGLNAHHYFNVRTAFNKRSEWHYNWTLTSARLLFLLAKCVKNSVRFNQSGDFNQSPDLRRLGRNPDRMRTELAATAALIHNRVTIRTGDYASALIDTTPEDVVYFDPPYQGVAGRDKRYAQQLDVSRFVDVLSGLRTQRIPFIVSFDNASYGKTLPAELGLKRTELTVGRSAQATLLGRHTITTESIYVSPEISNML